MRRIVIFVAVMLFSVVGAVAQNYIVVDSEKIFRSIDAYNAALESLDTLAEQYQKEVDDKFMQVEKLYQNYVVRKSSLSQSARTSYEDGILKMEAEAIEFQESIFSEQGKLFERRLELIAPLQQRVFKTIEEYAEANGYDMVIDLASNPAMLYKSPKVDKTDAIIELLKN